MIYVKKYNYSGLIRGELKKAESANGRQLLRYALQQEYGADLETLVIKEGEYGKPYFEQRREIHFNISHSGEYVALVLSDNEVGIDIQQVRPVRGGLVEKLCDENERKYVYASDNAEKAFITLWALKESYIKAIGKGMSFPMDKINFRLENFSGELHGRISNREGMYYVKDLGDYMLAVCDIGESGNFIAQYNEIIE